VPENWPSRNLGQGKGQVGAKEGEAKTILGPKSKELMVSSRTVARSRDGPLIARERQFAFVFIPSVRPGPRI
jgi:hypothetical protein